jgi:hypothetical protein
VESRKITAFSADAWHAAGDRAIARAPFSLVAVRRFPGMVNAMKLVLVSALAALCSWSSPGMAGGVADKWWHTEPGTGPDRLGLEIYIPQNQPGQLYYNGAYVGSLAISPVDVIIDGTGATRQISGRWTLVSG